MGGQLRDYSKGGHDMATKFDPSIEVLFDPEISVDFTVWFCEELCVKADSDGENLDLFVEAIIRMDDPDDTSPRVRIKRVWVSVAGSLTYAQQGSRGFDPGAYSGAANERRPAALLFDYHGTRLPTASNRPDMIELDLEEATATLGDAIDAALLEMLPQWVNDCPEVAEWRDKPGDVVTKNGGLFS